MSMMKSYKENKKNKQERVIKNILNSFSTDHIVIANVSRYERSYVPICVATIVGYYDEKNQKVIDINTGQVYEKLPIVYYEHMQDETIMNRIEMGKNYVRTVDPIDEYAMDSFEASRTYDFTTLKGVKENLVKPYQDFVKVTNGTKNIDYFYDIENQLEYFIQHCLFMGKVESVDCVDLFSNHKVKVSKYGHIRVFGWEPCYHYQKEGNAVVEGLRTGNNYQYINDIKDIKTLPITVIGEIRGLSYQQLDTKTINEIKERFFNSCGKIENKNCSIKKYQKSKEIK